MTTSASRAILRTTSCPSGVRRSTVTDFLLRFCTYHQREVPRCSFLHLRRGSPSGGSILMTSAPNSEKNFPAKGPAISCPSSITFNPSRGFVTAVCARRKPAQGPGVDLLPLAPHRQPAGHPGHAQVPVPEHLPGGIG